MKMKNTTRKSIIGYSFIAIWIIGFLLFTLYPMITSIIYSLNYVQVTGTGIRLTFNGLKNYGTIFSTYGANYLSALKSFAEGVLLRVLIITVFSLIIALLLNQNVRFRGLFRTIFFLPVIISSGPVLKQLTSQGASGTSMMSSLTFVAAMAASSNHFLSEIIAPLFSEIIIVFWFSGVQILLFLSSLQKMNKEIYEAAYIDGAGPWEAFWKITLPSLHSMIFISAIYSLVLLSTLGENGENDVVREIRANMNSINTGYGVASAMAWSYFLVLTAFLGIIALLFLPRNKGGKK